MSFMSRCLFYLNFGFVLWACGSAPSDDEEVETPVVDAEVDMVVDADVDAFVADEMPVDQMIDAESTDAGFVGIPLDCDENPEAEGVSPFVPLLRIALGLNVKTLNSVARV